MRCLDIDLISDQVRMKQPEEWFVLHMVGCKECRELFKVMRGIREVSRELFRREEYTEPILDETAREWMRWMTREIPPHKAVDQ